MKVQYWRNPSLEEDCVDVHYRHETETIDLIREFFASFNSIMGKREDGVYKLHPGSIYYLEVVDRKLFAYQEKEVYQLDYSLRSYLDLFGTNGFVQIGKSMAVNIYKINRIKADLNMRLRLQLDNGEILILNRSYKKAFMEMLQHIKEAGHENY